MLTAALITLFNRDLNKLKEELKQYNNEGNLWKVDKSVSNSGGNLALHIVGNLNTFIGANLGSTGYVRKRDLEFSLKDVQVADIVNSIEDCRVIVESTLKKLTPEDLQKEYRRNPFEDYMTTEYFLLHLFGHLTYHLGQINYHRRLLD